MALQLSKKTWVAVGCTALIVAAAVAVHVTDAPEPETNKALAACLTNKVSDERLYQLGETFTATGDIQWRALEAVGCRGFFGFAFDQSTRDKVGDASADQLLSMKSFRHGVYAGLGIQYQVPAQERSQLGHVGVYLEEGLKPAATALYCGALPENGADYLESITYPFTLAAIGNQAPSLTDEQVFDVAERVLESVQTVAQAQLTSNYDCAAENNAPALPQLLTFLDGMVNFRDGKHPMAPNCRADVTLTEVTLKCDAPGGEVEVSRSQNGQRLK